MSSRSVLGLAFATLVATSSALADPPQRKAFVVIDSGDWRAVAAALESRGARLPLRLPPDTLIGTLPPGIESELAALGLAGSVRIERQGGPALDHALPPNARAARRLLDPPRALPGAPEPRPLHGDSVLPLPGELRAPKSLPSGCDGPAATSGVLIGSVAIGILLPESLGPIEDSENWSTEDPTYPGSDRQDIVVAKILQGCDELVAQHPLAGLSFTIEARRSVGIPLEPIEHAVPDRSGWIDATLLALGYGAPSGSYGTGSYARDLRTRLGTDWAAVAYVVDDLNDSDNGFPPTGFPFAYALLGGPYMVMTYDNDGWGIERMNTVFRHELGHVFGAIDEYRSAGNSCGATAGFLRVKNGNNDSAAGDTACETNVACVMRGNDTTFACPFTEGQAGIRDTDADGIPDVRDAPPDSGFDAESPLLISSGDVTLRARASARPIAAESPHAPLAFTLNRVASAQWRLDGGPWTALAARDGAMGDRCEDLDVPLTGLAEGWHDVEVRATNDLGLLEPSPALLRLYVNADCADDAAEPDDAAAQAVARGAGTHLAHRCAYDSDWSRFFLQPGAAIGVTLTQADSSRALDMRLIDPLGVEIGRATSVAGVATISATARVRGVHSVVVEAASDFETDYSLLIMAACVDDVDEPDAPAPLGRESYPGILRARNLCAGDEDRYLVSLQAGETLQADLVIDPAFGDLDLEILDPSGAVAASSAGTGALETAALTPTTEGVHVVRVFGKTPSDRNAYDLTITASGCVDDAGENDDDLAGARPLAAGDTVRGVACGADEDWLGFVVDERRLVRLLLAHDPAGNLDLELWTSAGRRVARSTGSDGTEEISSERLARGSYRARIVGTGTTRVAWSLTFEEVDPLLLFVKKDPADALLAWNRSGQECFTLRRSENPADFSGALSWLVQEGDPSVPDGDRPIDDLGWRDRGVILDGTFLYCYLVEPHDCTSTLVGSIKSVEPYPVLTDGIGAAPVLDYEITLRNDALADVFGATFRDDLPAAAASFIVSSMPAGASDLSQPAPAGANLAGQVIVTGLDVPAGETRTVRIRMTVSPRSTYENPMIDNQGLVETGLSPIALPTIIPTDDSLTGAYLDDTRVLHASFTQQLLVQAFWHRSVDVDLVVTDPCGNVLSQRDLLTGDCAGQTSRVAVFHSCAAPSMQSRFERIVIGGFPPPPGDYIVSASYAGFSPGDPDCGGFGPEEVTAVVHGYNMPARWRTVTIAPGESRVEILRFTLP